MKKKDESRLYPYLSVLPTDFSNVLLCFYFNNNNHHDINDHKNRYRDDIIKYLPYYVRGNLINAKFVLYCC